jgi:hypothetical protein
MIPTKTIIDQTSNEVVTNPEYTWYMAGFKEALDGFETALNQMEELMDNGATTEMIIDRLIRASNVCPECRESKPDDDRVKNGMKCAKCTY